MTRVTEIDSRTGLLKPPSSWVESSGYCYENEGKERLENLEKKLGIERREFEKIKKKK